MTYPTIMPALTLDFQNSQQLDPRVTFSRSSGATYINSAGLVTSAAEHEPRFDHDPVTGECLGLLIEESRTNPVEYSEDLSNTYWNKQNCSLGATTTAPDGTNSAYLVIPNSTDTANHRVRVNASAFNQTRSQSCFAKAGGYNYAVFKNQNVDVVFDLSTGTANNSQGEMIPYPNGWYRCIFNSSAVIGSGVGWGCSANASGTGPGNDTDGVYLWGLQWENSANFGTSYIPTSGQAGGVLRSADIAQMTGDNFSSWYNQSEGTIAMNINPSILATNKTYYIFNGSSSTQRILCYTGTTSSPTLYINNGSLAVLSLPSMTPSIETKLAHGWSQTDVAGASNGVLNGPISASAPTTITSLDIAWSSTYFPATPVTMHLSRFAYYNERLTDAELQTLTS